MYTPTLVKIVLAQGYDVANALAVSRITRWKEVLTYMLIAWAGSVVFGITYGVLVGSL
ncbi:MAG: hypothetical protein QW327_01365 [Candidatus Odinarchaeota archaeon]